MTFTLPPFNFAQLLGFIAMALQIWSVSFKSDRRLNIIWMVSNAFWLAHFYLLGAHAGAINVFINFCRCATYVVRDWRATPHSKTIFLVLIAAYTLSAPFTIHTWVDVLPLLSSYAITVAFFVFSGIQGRLILMIGNIGWLIYALLHGSYGGVFTNITVIALGLMTVARMRADQVKTAAR